MGVGANPLHLLLYLGLFDALLDEVRDGVHGGESPRSGGDRAARRRPGGTAQGRRRSGRSRAEKGRVFPFLRNVMVM